MPVVVESPKPRKVSVSVLAEAAAVTPSAAAIARPEVFIFFVPVMEGQWETAPTRMPPHPAKVSQM
jgi:hypothetical protein